MMQVTIAGKKIFDPSTQKYVDEELPTRTVKAAVRSRNSKAGTALITYALGGGTEMRLTFYRVSAGTPAEFFLRDRGGTFDFPFLEARGAEAAFGGASDPLHVIRGTFEMGLVNNGTAGTFIVAYEGIVRYSGTETWD